MNKREFDKNGIPLHPIKRVKCKLWFLKYRVKRYILNPFRNQIRAMASELDSEILGYIIELKNMIEELEKTTIK